MQGRSDRLTYRSVNVTSPDEVAAKGVPGMYVLPATDGASDMVSHGSGSNNNEAHERSRCARERGSDVDITSFVRGRGLRGGGAVVAPAWRRRHFFWGGAAR